MKFQKYFLQMNQWCHLVIKEVETKVVLQKSLLYRSINDTKPVMNYLHAHGRYECHPCRVKMLVSLLQSKIMDKVLIPILELYFNRNLGEIQFSIINFKVDFPCIHTTNQKLMIFCDLNDWKSLLAICCQSLAASRYIACSTACYIIQIKIRCSGIAIHDKR